MDAWIFVLAAAAITVAPAIALTLLCRTEAQKGEERLLPRWAKARAMLTVATGGGAAMGAMPAMAKGRAKQPSSPPPPEPGADPRSD
jgi:hypothetical protein